MKTTLHWKKGTFSSSRQIFSGEERIGDLMDRTFKQTSEGIIRNKSYRFKTKGVFKQETQILDRASERVIGKITYNSMISKATIHLSDRTVYWKYDNGWQTKWSLFDDQGTLVKFAGRNSRGNIEYDMEDDLLVLIGMFVTNYYQQTMIAVFVAVFIPIWISIGN